MITLSKSVGDSSKNRDELPTSVHHNPPMTDECTPNFSKTNVRTRIVNFGKRPLDGLWLRTPLTTIDRVEPYPGRLTHRSKGGVLKGASSHACFFVRACKLFTNTKASSLNQPIATHRITVFSSHACVLYYKLANFLQIQTHHQAT
jgi:hypothetical protein